MSVESEILRIQHNIAGAYAKVAEKGGEVPLQPTSATLAAAIGTIPGGGASAGEVYSTEEIRVGTWIDGKPLYRKTFKTVHSSVPVRTWIDFGLVQDIDYVMFVNGRISGIEASDRIVDLHSSSFLLGMTKNGPLQFYTSNYSLGHEAISFITVEYTKTTDQAPEEA